MTYLTGQGIINDALSIAPGGGASVRAKMLIWTNIIAQKLATVRDWQFLSNGSAVIAPSDNVVTLPGDYGQFQSIKGGTAFFMDATKRLTPGEAFALDQSATGQSTPRGFTEQASTITLHGAGYTDPVTLAYTIEPSAITDSATATAWPVKCRALFQRSLLTAYYEFDFDERQGVSLQLDAAELYELKKWDNQQKPIPKFNHHGYRRTR